MISTRKNKHQQKKLLSQLNGPLNEFFIVNVSVMENESLEFQTNGHCSDLERTVDSETHNQLIGNSSGDKKRKVVDSSVLSVKNHTQNAFLTTMDNVVIPRVEMAVRSITESSGQGRSNVVQKFARRDLTGNTLNTLLMPAPSRLNLIVD